MIVGTVKEIKIGENRVGLTPYGAHVLTQAGHKVLVEMGAGIGSGFSDEDYQKAGVEIVSPAEKVYQRATLIIKVKEPQPKEFKFYRPGLILYTYLHLAAEPAVTKMLLKKKVTGIAYETVELPNGSLPLLTPMSEIAGRMAPQVGAWFLQRTNRGRGKLLGGVPGVLPGKVVILGSGVVATNAAKMAIGLGAEVTILGRNLERLRYLNDIFVGRLKTQFSYPAAIEEELSSADLVISGVLITGGKTPKLVTRKMLKKMKKGTVVVDVAIDQGGSFETSRLTTHDDPVYEVEGILHYCVTNMPAAVPETSTLALTNATIKYALDLATKGFRQAILADSVLLRGVNTFTGHLTYKEVAKALNLKHTSIEKLI